MAPFTNNPLAHLIHPIGNLIGYFPFFSECFAYYMRIYFLEAQTFSERFIYTIRITIYRVWIYEYVQRREGKVKIIKKIVCMYCRSSKASPFVRETLKTFACGSSMWTLGGVVSFTLVFYLFKRSRYFFYFVIAYLVSLVL